MPSFLFVFRLLSAMASRDRSPFLCALPRLSTRSPASSSDGRETSFYFVVPSIQLVTSPSSNSPHLCVCPPVNTTGGGDLQPPLMSPVCVFFAKSPSPASIGMAASPLTLSFSSVSLLGPHRPHFLPPLPLPPHPLKQCII